MPQAGYGVVPPSGATFNELNAITRRAFIPKLYVQLYSATPTLNLLFRNMQSAMGGLSQITVPVQGSSMVTTNYIGYDGTFPQPTQTSAIHNAEFNLSVSATPIPFYGMEAIIQSSEVVIPRLKALMADAKTVVQQRISQDLFVANSSSGNLAPFSLAQAYDDGTNYNTYGGISRSTNAFWKSTLKTSVGAIDTRAKLAPYLAQATQAAGGETPDLIVMNPSDWATLEVDFINSEQYVTNPGSVYGKDDVVNAGFRCLSLSGVPIVMDVWCPKGTIYFLNSKYLAMYVHDEVAFAFSGFYSTIPNLQIANLGVLLLAFNFVCTKPSSGMQITGVSGQVF
jgi:hypothetical protein